MSTSTQFIQSRITGIGSYLPEQLITNKDLEKMVDTSDEWITERTGIRARHKAADNQVTSDLALEASRIAIEQAGIQPTDLDMILLATVTPDTIMPSTACNLQHKLGAGNCMAVDLAAACSGLIYNMAIADQFIKTGACKNILCVGAEVLTRFVDYEDRNTCILFGDGAAAVVLSASQPGDNSYFYSHHMHAEGALGPILVIPGGGSAIPPRAESVAQKKHFVDMQGREIFKAAVRAMGRCVEEALEANNLSARDIDWLVPHQANIRIIEAVAKQAKFPMEKVIVEIADVGNTSASTVGIALDRAIRDGRIQRGHTILLSAFGGGLTSGSILLKY